MLAALACRLPNALTLSRLALGLAFPWLPAEWRFAAIGAAAVTDCLDGWLARRLGAQSDLGRLLDPVADKAFVLVLAVTLVLEGALAPGWALAVAARDVAVLGGVAWVAARRRWAAVRGLRPSWSGKLTTAAQFALLLVLVGTGAAPGWLLGLTAALSVVAAAGYLRRREPGLPAGVSVR